MDGGAVLAVVNVVLAVLLNIVIVALLWWQYAMTRKGRS